MGRGQVVAITAHRRASVARQRSISLAKGSPALRSSRVAMAKDLSYHLVYGVGVAAAYEALDERLSVDERLPQ